MPRLSRRRLPCQPPPADSRVQVLLLPSWCFSARSRRSKGTPTDHLAWWVARAREGPCVLARPSPRPVSLTLDDARLCARPAWARATWRRVRCVVEMNGRHFAHVPFLECARLLNANHPTDEHIAPLVDHTAAGPGRILPRLLPVVPDAQSTGRVPAVHTPVHRCATAQLHGMLCCPRLRLHHLPPVLRVGIVHPHSSCGRLLARATRTQSLNTCCTVGKPAVTCFPWPRQGKVARCHCASLPGGGLPADRRPQQGLRTVSHVFTAAAGACERMRRSRRISLPRRLPSRR